MNNDRRIRLFNYLGFYPVLVLMVVSAFVSPEIEKMLMAVSILPACNLIFYGVILNISE